MHNLALTARLDITPAKNLYQMYNLQNCNTEVPLALL